MKNKDILAIVQTALNEAGIRASATRKRELLSSINRQIRSKTWLVTINGDELGGYRDPMFSEVEDGAGGIRDRYHLTSLDTGRHVMTLSQRHSGEWRVWDIYAECEYEPENIMWNAEG